MTMSFKERIAQRAKEAQQAPTVELPKEEPKPIAAPKRFGQPKAPEEAAPKQDATQDAPSVAEAPKSKFGGFKKPIQVDLSAAANILKEEPKEESPLPKVIQAYNTVGGQAAPTEGELLSGHEGDEAVRRIQEKIRDLGMTDSQTDLKMEMQKLSEMLVANPAACLYLLDEDLGLAVHAMRRLTNNRVAIDMAAAKPSTKAKSLTAAPLSVADMQAAFDEL